MDLFLLAISALFMGYYFCMIKKQNKHEKFFEFIFIRYKRKKAAIFSYK